MIKIRKLVANNIEITTLDGDYVKPLFGVPYFSPSRMSVEKRELVLNLELGS